AKERPKGLSTKLRSKIIQAFERERWRKQKKLFRKPGCQLLARLARDLYISAQMQLRFPQLPSSTYRAAVEQEIRTRGYSIESMLRAANAATTWDKDEAWDMVRAALERQHPKSSW